MMGENMDPIIQEYFRSVVLFEYRQFIDEMEEKTMMTDSSTITFRHNDTIYCYDFREKELSVINDERVNYFINHEAIQVLYRELPQEEYRLFEREAFARL